LGQKTPMDMSKLDHRHRNYPWDYVREGVPGQLLRIKLADEGGTTVIDHFGAARGAVVDLLGSHFTTAAEAFAAVRSDGAGGSMLTFSGSALVHFVGVTNLTAVNFKRLLLGSRVVRPGAGNRAEGVWCASKSGSS